MLVVHTPPYGLDIGYSVEVLGTHPEIQDVTRWRTVLHTTYILNLFQDHDPKEAEGVLVRRSLTTLCKSAFSFAPRQSLAMQAKIRLPSQVKRIWIHLQYHCSSSPAIYSFSLTVLAR